MHSQAILHGWVYDGRGWDLCVMKYHVVHICRGRTYGRDRNIMYWTSIASIKLAVHWSFGCFVYYRNYYTLFKIGRAHV